MCRMMILLAAAILPATTTAARAAVWKMDKAHSQVKFSVAHLVFSEVTGVFKDVDATMISDKDDFTDGQIEATIKSVSIDTGNEGRDRDVRSDSFLNSERFPELRFKSTKVEKTGDGTYAITGNLTIRDVTRSVVLQTKYNGTITDPWGNTRSAFMATTTIDRFDYGVKWDKTMDTGGLIAGKDVKITLLMEFVKSK